MTKWIGHVPAVLMQFYGGQEAGTFDVWVGSSSKDIRLKGSFELTL